jgi:hypothetical protein
MDGAIAGVAMKRAAVLLVLAACESSPAPIGIDEPLRVRGAQFVEGPLPPNAGGPAVTIAASENPIILAGQAQKLFNGRAHASASAVAVRFADVGTGHWVFPIGDPDPQYPGELTWSMTADFAYAIAPGRRALAFSAIDAAGRSGPVHELGVCVGSRIPDNQQACDPSRPLPAVVLSLTWDVDVDLDLVVVAPDGRELTAKKSQRVPGEPSFDRDSLATCTPDATRTENLVFPARPSGRYGVYVSLFDACGEAAVRFTFEAYDGRARTIQQSGRMIAFDANGGRDRGLFVTELLY